MKDISAEYFSICPELAIIQEPFNVKDLNIQFKRRDIESQFQLLRALTETKKHKLKLRMNSILQNKRNRYPQQSIYEQTRVKLISNSQSTKNTYINANYIANCQQKHIIITQGPLQSTTQQFFEMVEQQKIQCILMLCQCIENNKVRCHNYLSAVQILQENILKEGVQKRKIKTKSNYETLHIQYKNWPDRDIPNDKQGLRILINQAMKYDRLAIHCSAGLGRSGVVSTIISILSLLNSGINEISIFGDVRKMRECRYQSVQNNQQYKFIYEYLIFHLQL